MRKLLNCILFLSVIVLLASCGGGGGSGGGSVATGPATVAFLVTDASSEDYDEAIATISEITLICEKGQQNIFSGSITVDLLRLRDHLDLLAVANDIEPGICSKIRLHVDRLLLIKRDRDGNIVEEIEAELVANGKIDLNPREKFRIRAAEKLFITLDFDVDKSLKFMETGNGKVKIRPVIFVEIGKRPIHKNGLTRILGRVDKIADDLAQIRLCRTAMVAAALEFNQGDYMPERCVRVSLDERTGIFGEDGEPIEASELALEDPITVVGFLRVKDDGEFDDSGDSDDSGEDSVDAAAARGGDSGNDPDRDSGSDSDSDSDSDGRPGLAFVLDAIVVERGEKGTFARIPGVLQSGVDPGDDSYLLLARSSDSTNVAEEWLLDGQLYPQSRIFTFEGKEIDRFDLKAEDKVLVDGVVIPADMVDANPTLRTSFMLVKPFDGTEPPMPAERVLIGKVETVDPDTQTLMVATDTGSRCVLADGAEVLFLVESNGSFDVIKGDIEDLPDNALVVIFGVEDIGGCFDADAIVSRGPMKPEPGPEPL